MTTSNSAIDTAIVNEPVKNHPQKAVSIEPKTRQLMALTIDRRGFEFGFRFNARAMVTSHKQMKLI